jgi:hypothetical protein
MQSFYLSVLPYIVLVPLKVRRSNEAYCSLFLSCKQNQREKGPAFRLIQLIGASASQLIVNVTTELNLSSSYKCWIQFERTKAKRHISELEMCSWLLVQFNIPLYNIYL